MIFFFFFFFLSAGAPPIRSERERIRHSESETFSYLSQSRAATKSANRGSNVTLNAAGPMARSTAGQASSIVENRHASCAQRRCHRLSDEGSAGAHRRSRRKWIAVLLPRPRAGSKSRQAAVGAGIGNPAPVEALMPRTTTSAKDARVVPAARIQTPRPLPAEQNAQNDHGGRQASR